MTKGRHRVGFKVLEARVLALEEELRLADGLLFEMHELATDCLSTERLNEERDLLDRVEMRIYEQQPTLRVVACATEGAQ